ncbi:MAG: hypothetical protein HY329_12495 [Chloroflexi bacterium]|nr:hypothetical protein [Chloroflexota bacterium]
MTRIGVWLVLLVSLLPLWLTDGTLPIAAQTGETGAWRIVDDGAFVTAENATYRLRFAYAAANQQGWFRGTGTGGGGNDGAIVELYHKPTSPTHNLVFRNGTWGSAYDALDGWEADATAFDWRSHADADLSSNRHGRVLSHDVRQSGGTLYANFEVEFAAWRIQRRYVVAPAGLIAVNSDVEVIREGHWNYLAHRFNFAGKRYEFRNGQTYRWGGDYQESGGRYLSWTDGVNRHNGKQLEAEPRYARVEQPIRPFAQSNTGAHSATGRDDSYSGFLIVGNGASPGILLVQGAPSDWDGPFSAIARRVAQDPRSLSTDYRSYVETALFSFDWAPNDLTQVGTIWFYMTTPGISPDGNIWNKRGYWSKDLGKWTETFYVVIQAGLTAADYLPTWERLTRGRAEATPRSWSVQLPTVRKSAPPAR